MSLLDHPPRGQRSTVPAFGPQAELCRRTHCCLCWASKVIRSAGCTWDHTVMYDYDWSQLPLLDDCMECNGDEIIHPHHEPPRGTACASEDTDTIPLCPKHHMDAPLLARHSEYWQYRPEEYYDYFGVDWKTVRDDMSRRVSE